MGLVGDHDDIRPIRELGEGLALRRAEFLNQGEDVPLIALKHLLQMLTVLRLYLFAFLCGRAAIYECVGDLPVQLGAICNDYEGPIAGLCAQNLLREIEHRKTLARTLRVPEHT